MSETIPPPANYIENQVLILPNISEKTFEIGELWNCQTSTCYGRNLFSTQQLSQPKNLIVTPIQRSDFELSHIKSTKDLLQTRKVNGEISIDILSGFIKPEGSFNYFQNSKTNQHEETLSLRYYNETFRVTATGDLICNEAGRRDFDSEGTSSDCKKLLFEYCMPLIMQADCPINCTVCTI